MSSTKSQDEMWRNMVAASVCIGGAVVLFNPLDCLRIRWQVSRANGSLFGFARQVVREEGFRKGLWAPGVGSNALGGAMARGIGMGCYPAVRDLLIMGTGDAEKGPVNMFLGGVLSGGVGYGLSSPLWQAKTRLQAGAGRVEKGILVTGLCKGMPQKHRNWAQVLGSIAREEGVLQLYRGCSALVARGALMNGGNTLGYDGMKTYMRSRGHEEGVTMHVAASVTAAFLSSTFSMGRTYSGLMQCALGMMKEEGPAVFLRGWLPMFSRVAPLYIVYLPAYEQTRMLLGMTYMD